MSISIFLIDNDCAPLFMIKNIKMLVFFVNIFYNNIRENCINNKEMNRL